MKKLLYIIPLLLFSLTACDSVDFGDINEDDDEPTQPNTQALMAAAMNDFFTNGGRNYYGKPLLYVQYRSQYVYTAESLYGEEEGDWFEWYVDCLNNLKTVVEANSGENVSPDVLRYGSAENQIGVAEIFSAFVWKRITDAFGPVPYEKALSDSVNSPPYTSQEVIYKDLISRIQTARDMLNPGGAGPTGDVVYGGNVTNWQKFANSLLLSFAIQMSNVFPNAGDYAAQVFNEALNHSAGVIDEIPEEAWYNFSTTSGSQNPISGFRRPDYSLSEAFVNAMSGQANGTVVVFSSDTFDERLPLYNENDGKPGRPYGIAVNGNEPAGSEFAAVSLDLSAAGAPLHYMTAAYTYLNRAEAAALGWTSEVAVTMLEQAIIISFESLDQHYIGDGIGDADFDLASEGPVFATARIADAATAPGGILQVIREEKWVSLFPRPFQAWSERRRTEVPWLLPAPDAVNDGTIPSRYPFPGGEAGVNSQNYAEGVSMLEPAEDSNTSRFWWDVE